MKLKELYKKEILPALKKELNIKSSMAVPRITKVAINVGFGKHVKDKELIKFITVNLEKISGQKPVLTKAKKAISAFKVRQDMVIGAKVTIRGDRMYDFVERLVNVYFPRVRDFRGVSDKAIDKTGNITLGFKDIVAFPEVEEQDITHGLEVSITTTAKDREAGLALFKMLKFPFKK